MAHYIEDITQDALDRLAGCTDPRLREIVSKLTTHLHAFVRDVKPTEQEWMAGIRFLTEVGQKCSDVRQEYILLSDVLGVSMLIDALVHQKPEGATTSSVLGPFYRESAPMFRMGDSISGKTEGNPVVVSGRVLDGKGAPIVGALVDVWQTAPNGLYEVQDPEQPEFNLRGRFVTGADGCYSFHTVAPVSYPIPDDGPVGKLLRGVGRHPYRPAHIHFIVSAPGYEPVVTQIFSKGDEYLDSDAVFGVKNSLIVDYVDDGDGLKVNYDFVLAQG